MILTGFLASVGAIAFVPAIVLCMLGETINGYLWYMVGYFAGAKPIDKWGRSKPKSRKVIETVERYFQKYSGRAILITKLTWSLTIATMIMAGSFKYNLKKFSFYNAIGSAAWAVGVFYVGFVFGKGFKAVSLLNSVSHAVLFLAGAIILIYILKQIFKSKFVKSLYAMERLREIGERLRDNIDRLIQ